MTNNPGGIVVFSFLASQQKGKRNNKLCDLCVSVVIIKSLTIKNKNITSPCLCGGKK